jgi:4-diphosphocytidyl-2-C-methyl-D-erythritol kinase
MVCFPGAKINIGLNIVAKREDGFHDIETVFYPINLCDILEIIPSSKENAEMESSGLILDVNDKDNICMKAYQILKQDFKLPSVEIYLHKIIPSGAGLGGGSSDAANTLKLINQIFELEISVIQLKKYAAVLGSDCSFFIENTVSFAYGRGELVEAITLNLSNYYIYLIKPDVFISTADAYKSMVCSRPEKSLKELINLPVEKWKGQITNDFEKNIFQRFPKLDHIRQDLYNAGAVYASMSGSGSSIYGIFYEKPEKLSQFSKEFSWISKL